MANDLVIVVNGEAVKCDFMDTILKFDSMENISEAAARVAQWGSIVALAAEKADLLDANYRSWFSSAMLAVMQQGGDKTAEWKVKAAVEGGPGAQQFLKFKTEIAAAQKDLSLAQGMLQGYIHKAKLLESMGWKVAAESRAADSYPMVYKH